ncbi:AMP-binding protein [Amycolatopsis sp. NPDC051102]|uniref:AMP-binding protein n=1 Tax=Amycolatopsis sp. NPDC051102 TaxID=3155163 RepID=UPI003434306B
MTEAGVETQLEPIYARFVALAEDMPHRIAISSPQGAMSYGCLLGRAQAVAYALAKAGVTPNSRVLLLTKRDPELVVGMLGILLAGGCFAILDQSYPRKRLHEMARVARPTAAVIAGGPDLSLQAPRVHTASVGAARKSATSILPTGTSAYIAFTSGTTGTPKGIVGEHAPVVHYVRWSTPHFELSSNDRFSMLSGLTHDPLLRDIFVPLSIGASIHIPDALTWARAKDLAAWLAHEAITVTSLTPSMARRVLAHNRAHLPRMRRVILGGESVRWNDIRVFRSAAPSARFTGVYGMTETPQVAMHNTLEQTDIDSAVGTVPLGVPAPGYQIELTKPDGSEAANGEPGVITLFSPHLALGYIDGVQINPIGTKISSGDLACLSESGQLLYVGRNDRQVKIRGLRVELQEVEEVVRRFPGVLDAVVVATSQEKSQDHGEPTLAATAVVAEGTQITSQQLRAHLAGLLPIGAIPPRIRVVTDLPITPNGKIDLSHW